MTTVMLKVLLIGKTGEGKSSTGNKILNKEVFEKSAGVESKTKYVKSSSVLFKNYDLIVVDGPGLDDTAMTQAEDRETFAWNMTIALAMCCDGVDAFILVIRFPIRFTTQERSAIESLKRIFGDRFMSHVIVLVTFGDIFCAKFDDDNPKTFDEWCREQGGAFRDLYDECQGRVVLFNNKEKDENKKLAQIQQVVGHAHSLQTKLGPYTSKYFEDAKEQREKLLRDLKAVEMKPEFQKKIGLLTAALEEFCTNPEKGNTDAIKARIDDLNREIDQHGMLDNLRHLMEKLVEDLNDAESLQRLYSELRETKDIWDGILPANPALRILGYAALYSGYAAMKTVSDLTEGKNKSYSRLNAVKIQEDINKIKNKRMHRQQLPRK